MRTARPQEKSGPFAPSASVCLWLASNAAPHLTGHTCGNRYQLHGQGNFAGRVKASHGNCRCTCRCAYECACNVELTASGNTLLTGTRTSDRRARSRSVPRATMPLLLVLQQLPLLPENLLDLLQRLFCLLRIWFSHRCLPHGEWSTHSRDRHHPDLLHPSPAPRLGGPRMRYKAYSPAPRP